MTILRACLFVFIGFFLFSLGALASRGPSPILDPRSYVSPDGRYTLMVNPSDLHGRGSAVYQFFREGERVWMNELPFTVWEARVTDVGFVVGYAYTFGPDGFSEEGVRAGPGNFHVAILNHEGEFVLNDAVERERSRFLHDVPNPLARGLIIDGANDRMVVRVREADLNVRREWWWTYRLSTGELRDKIPQPPAIQAELVRGTPLVAAHYWRYVRPDVGARFALVDPDGNEVWSKTLPRDYHVPDDEETEEKLRNLIRRDGAILDTNTPNEFEIVAAADAEAIRFSVRAEGNEWKVEEISRRPFQRAEPAPPELPDVPEEPLAYLGSFSFGRDLSEETPISWVVDFDLDDRERIGFIQRHPAGDLAFRLVDESGRMIEDVLLDIPPSLWNFRVLWLKEDHWLIFASETGVGARAFAWSIDAATREQTSLPTFESAAIERVARSHGGGFVALARRRARYTSDTELTAFDEEGRTLWTVTGHGGGNPVAGGQDLTVTGDDEIAVLNQGRRSIQFFDLSGRERRSLNLEEAWGRRPIYLSALSGDGGGRLLVRSSGAGSSVVKMTTDGDVLAEFAPAFVDGRPIDSIIGIRFSPSGAIWVGERELFVRLNGKGVAEVTLGTAPGEKGLTRVSEVSVDNRGTLYAADDRSGIVYIYDDEGKPQGFRPPDPTEADEIAGLRLEGARADFTALGLNGVRGRWYRLPEGLLVVGYENAYVLDAEKAVTKIIRRRPDNNWLAYPDRASVAPDGSFVIESQRRLHYGERGWWANVYDAAGEPLGTVKFSSEFQPWAFCYNGDFLAAQTDTHVWLFDAEGTPLRKFALPAEDYSAFLTARDGSELWLISTLQKHVVRFAFPSR